MNKKHLYLIIGLLLCTSVFLAYQVSQASPAIPNPGHGTSELEGNASLNMNSNKIINLSTPTAATDAATKAYVDAAGTAPGNLCPSEIESSDRAAVRQAVAVTTCRNLGGDWRLPTQEELACFCGISGATATFLITRTSPGDIATDFMMAMKLNTCFAYPKDMDGADQAFRCVQ